MRKLPSKFLSVCCASLMALNASAFGALAENSAEDVTTAEALSPIIFDGKDDAVLYWATQIGQDKEWWSDSPTGFTVAPNGFIYICSADSIVKIDKLTGKIVAKGQMAGSAMYATKGPAFGNDMVFMALDNGTIQAFDADTLASRWIYRNKLGGSPKCDIVYEEGKIYTGFWNGDEADADYVCIDVTADDETSTMEDKFAEWEVTNKGGYYWTSPYITNDYVYLGRENGNDPSTTEGEDVGGIFEIDRKSGSSKLKDYDIIGDVRSGLVDINGKIAFTSREGVFHIYDPARSTLSSIRLADALGLEGFTCTSTPIIIDNRAYVTLNGPGWDDYNGSCIAVLNLTEYDTNFDIHIAYTVETKKACQAKGIFAGVDAEGYNVIYYVENSDNGSIRMLRDKAGMKEPLAEEELDAEGNAHKVAPVIFAPPAEYAQYCAVDPVYDESTGLIFVRYDSFNLCAIGSAIEDIEFLAESRTIHPNGVKTLVYMADQTPTDPEDSIIALSGGYLQGIEDSFSEAAFSVDKFKADDEVFTVTLNYGIATGTGYKPHVSEDIAVLVAETEDQFDRALANRGDINGDGKITVTDISLAAAHVKSVKAVDKYSFNAADINNDGKITVTDISGIAGHVKSIKEINTAR